MISNTDLFYARAKTYQERRAAIVSSYDTRMKALERTKGSVYYTDECKKAAAAKEQNLTALKAEYWEYFNIAFKAMREANAGRSMTPPTEAELRTLQLLKMRDKPTEAELDAAAKTLKGNVMCLSILTEISHSAGYLKSYEKYAETKEMSITTAEGTIDGLYKAVRDFMDYDTTKAARISREAHERQYGLTEADKNRELPKRPLFETKAECFEIIAGLSGDRLEAFKNAVDVKEKETA